MSENTQNATSAVSSYVLRVFANESVKRGAAQSAPRRAAGRRSATARRRNGRRRISAPIRPAPVPRCARRSRRAPAG